MSTTPCADPANNPEDWFISKDGKQYADDELVSQDQVYAALELEHPEWRTTSVDTMHGWAAEIREKLEAEATKASLVKRRHAKDLCHTECPLRMECLTIAIDQRAAHGTWGGYTEEELRKIFSEMDARRNRRDARLARQSQDADAAGGE